MMKHSLITSLILLLVTHLPVSLAFQTSYGQYKASQFSGKVVLVNWNSEIGKKRLSDSKYNNDFFQLAHHFQPQSNPLYCGIATSVMVLNALRVGMIPSQEPLEVKKPKVWGGGKILYPLYSQLTFLNAETDKIKSRDIIRLENVTPENEKRADVFDPGLTLAQLKNILETYQVKVSLYYAEHSQTHDVDTFRNRLKEVLTESKQFLIINYKSDLVGQAGGGHISPIGAYESQSDSVLILDVSGHLNPWVWIPVHDLYQSMSTKDGNHFRGYLIVQDSSVSS